MSWGTKMDAWIKQAQDLGLVVEIEDQSEGILQSVLVTITRVQVEEHNALDQYLNSQQIVLHSLRTFNEGKWTNHARYASIGTKSWSDLRISNVPHHIRSLAKD